MKQDIIQLGLSRSDLEPKPDLCRCSSCGWDGPRIGLEQEDEGDFESGPCWVDLCPKCEDGGCIDDYFMSWSRSKLWDKWYIESPIGTKIPSKVKTPPLAPQSTQDQS